MTRARATVSLPPSIWVAAADVVVRRWRIPGSAILLTAGVGVASAFTPWWPVALLLCLPIVSIGLVQQVLGRIWTVRHVQSSSEPLGVEFHPGGVAFELGGLRYWFSGQALSACEVLDDAVRLPAVGLMPAVEASRGDFDTESDFEAAVGWVRRWLTAGERVPWPYRPPESLVASQRVGAYDLAAVIWDELFWPPEHPWAAYLSSAFDALGGRPGPWLDLGCGGGRLLAQADGPWPSRVGLEANAALASRARSAVAPRGHSAVFLGDNLDVLPAGGFALITASSMTLHHLVVGCGLPAFIAQVADRLLPEGLFLFDFLVTGGADVVHVVPLGLNGPPGWLGFRVEGASGRMVQHIDLGDAWEVAEGASLRRAEIEEAAWAVGLEVALVRAFRQDQLPVPVQPGALFVALRRPLDP